MPLLRSKPFYCFRDFSDHVNHVLNKTITQRQLCIYSDRKVRSLVASMSFGKGKWAQPRGSKYKFSIFQKLRASPEKIDGKNNYRLETIEYGYFIARRNEDNPIIRFEYLRYPIAKDNGEIGKHCRHHVQICSNVNGIYLEDVHIPTGWVTIEEFIRFFIVDLEAKSLCKDWDEVLQNSEKRFYEEFTSKRYHSP